MSATQMMGLKIHRREDPKLITGEGRFIEDLVRPGTLTMAFVRSPHPHARITRIDTSPAKAMPGVIAVYTAADFKAVLKGTHPVAPAFVAQKHTVPERFPLAEGEVLFQGEPVVAVVAENRKLANDAAAAIEVEYDPLPAVMDLFKALEPNSPKVQTGRVDNLGWDFTYVGEDAVKDAFAQADAVIKERVVQQRLAPTPIETRGVTAEYSQYDDQLTVWMGSQNPHLMRLYLASAMGIPETRLRVISHDVGGAFGSKANPYPEDYLVAATAKMLKRPVRW